MGTRNCQTVKSARSRVWTVVLYFQWKEKVRAQITGTSLLFLSWVIRHIDRCKIISNIKHKLVFIRIMSYSVLSETILPLLNFFLEVKDSVYDSAIRKRVGSVSIHGENSNEKATIDQNKHNLSNARRGILGILMIPRTIGKMFCRMSRKKLNFFGRFQGQHFMKEHIGCQPWWW